MKKNQFYTYLIISIVLVMTSCGSVRIDADQQQAAYQENSINKGQEHAQDKPALAEVGKTSICILKQDPILKFLRQQTKTKTVLLLEEHKQRIISEQAAFISGLNRQGKKPYQALDQWQKVINAVLVDEQVDELPKTYLNQLGVKCFANMEVKANVFEANDLLNIEKVWRSNENGSGMGQMLQGQGIKIGIIDTGIDSKHPDFGSCEAGSYGCKVLQGYNALDGSQNAADDHGHGTHVAAIAAGNGVRGLAPHAKLVPIKVLNASGSGSMQSTLDGIEYATDPNQDDDFSDALDVINLSLGGPGTYDDPSSQAINNALLYANVLPVVAAGNNGPAAQTILSPGVAEHALTVGAIDKNDEIASFSSRGPVLGLKQIKPNVVAYGVDMCAAQYNNLLPEKECGDSYHIKLNGTSMATPVVAGVAAILRQAHPSMTAQQIKQVIINHAEPLGNDIYAYGAGKVSIDNMSDAGLFNPSQVIAVLRGQQDYSNNIFNVKAIVADMGAASATYKLFLGEGINPTAWHPIAGGLVSSDLGYQNLTSIDLTQLNNTSVYTLKLSVFNEKFGVWQHDFIYLFHDPVSLSHIPDLYTHANNHEVEIKGRINMSDYIGHKLYIKAHLANQWTTQGMSLNNIQTSVNEQVLGYLDTKQFSQGFYDIRLEAVSNSNQVIVREQLKVYIDSSYQVGFPAESVGEQVLMDPIIKDMDGDGQVEIIVVGKTGKIAIYNSQGQMLPNFPTQINMTNLTYGSENDFLAPPTIMNADLFNYNPQSEVFYERYYANIFSSYYDPILTALRMNGSTTLQYFDMEGYDSTGNLVCNTMLNLRSRVTDDFDGDGFKETLVDTCRFAGSSQSLNVFSEDLTLKASINIPVKNSTVAKYSFSANKTMVTVEDHNGQIQINRYDTNLQPIDAQPFVVINEAYTDYHQILAADLNQDGNDELVFQLNNDIYVFDDQGNLFSAQWPQTTDNIIEELAAQVGPEVFASNYAAISVGDIDGDGQLEVMANRILKSYIWDHQGSLLSGWPVEHMQAVGNAWTFSPVGQPKSHLHRGSIEDINGDGSKEAVFVPRNALPDTSGTYKLLEVVSANGEINETLSRMFPSVVSGRSYSSPVVYDLDQDGDQEVIVVDDFGQLRVWDL